MSAQVARYSTPLRLHRSASTPSGRLAAVMTTMYVIVAMVIRKSLKPMDFMNSFSTAYHSAKPWMKPVAYRGRSRFPTGRAVSVLVTARSSSAALATLPSLDLPSCSRLDDFLALHVTTGKQRHADGVAARVVPGRHPDSVCGCAAARGAGPAQPGGVTLLGAGEQPSGGPGSLTQMGTGPLMIPPAPTEPVCRVPENARIIVSPAGMVPLILTDTERWPSLSRLVETQTAGCGAGSAAGISSIPGQFSCTGTTTTRALSFFRAALAPAT